jgi:ectoine hydroxylase-related dioxygenase (phytanoyl-CoA dioxygenase family)
VTAFDLESHTRRIDEDGYTIIPDFLDAGDLAEAKRVLRLYLGSHDVRNNFEGYRTERVYTLVARGRIFCKIVLDARILALCARYLEPGFLLTASQGIEINPEETPQPFHFDDAFYSIPRPRPMVSLSTIVAIDAFTSQNGGTQVIRGSHRWGDDRIATGVDSIVRKSGGEMDAALEPEAVTVEMPAGGCVVFSGALVHRGGANHSSAPRLGFSNQIASRGRDSRRISSWLCRRRWLATRPSACGSCSATRSILPSWASSRRVIPQERSIPATRIASRRRRAPSARASPSETGLAGFDGSCSRMFVDARTVPDGSRIESDVCIIGAGAAGITIARELRGRPLRVALLESGWLTPDATTQSLYAGEVSEQRYFSLDSARNRYFGGTTNKWNGECRLLDAQDFEPRDWIPDGGWPFGLDHLLPFYDQAQSLCQLGPFAYAADDWRERGVRPIAFPSERIHSCVLHYSPPTRFGRVYRDDLEGATNVVTYLGANVVDLETPNPPNRVSAARVACLSGSGFRVAARLFILATGGIENADSR